MADSVQQNDADLSERDDTAILLEQTNTFLERLAHVGQLDVHHIAQLSSSEIRNTDSGIVVIAGRYVLVFLRVLAACMRSQRDVECQGMRTFRRRVTRTT